MVMGVFPSQVQDSDGFGPPALGGVLNCKAYLFNYNDTGIGSGVTAFTLPYNAEIIAWELIIRTAFNAGTTNTLDVGTTGALTQYLSAGAVLGSTGQAFPAGFVPAQMFSVLAANTPITVKYNQTGTAASAGVGILIAWYITR